MKTTCLDLRHLDLEGAIAAYVLSGVIARILYKVRWTGADGATISLKAWLYDNLFASWIPDYYASLAWASAHVLLILGIVWLLYRKRIFIKV